MEGKHAPLAKILSVDDTPANLFAMRAVLAPLGHAIVDAASGAEALELVARDEFAVILLDVMMPIMDGMETLARLRDTAVLPQTSVILVTAGEMDLSLVERAYGLGAVDFVAKPFPPSILRGKVRTLMSLYEVTQELRAQQARLAQEDRNIAVLAHDLRNPLNTVVSGMQVLLRSDLPARTRHVSERISRAANRMAGMIEDLLGHARAGVGGIPISRGPMDIGRLCRELVEEFETADPNRKIALSLTGDLQGEWDVARMYQALSNLVGNATHYGDGSASVEVDGCGDYVQIAVFNHGPPIPPDLLPELFKPFKRGREDGVGLGLGLYIVNAIAQAHGGNVSVDSSREDGTTFVLRLPRRDGAVSSQNQHA